MKREIRFVSTGSWQSGEPGAGAGERKTICDSSDQLNSKEDRTDAEAVDAFVAGLHRALSPLCKDDYILRQKVSFEHAPGTRHSSTWVDSVAITSFGVFVIKRVGWQGTISLGAERDELHVVSRRGELTSRTCPLRRVKPVVRVLRALLVEHDCPVESVAIFSETDSVLCPTVSESLLKASELFHFLRIRLNRFVGAGRRPINLDAIARHLNQRCVEHNWS